MYVHTLMYQVRSGQVRVFNVDILHPACTYTLMYQVRSGQVRVFNVHILHPACTYTLMYQVRSGQVRSECLTCTFYTPNVACTYTGCSNTFIYTATDVSGQVRSGQVRSECLTCTFYTPHVRTLGVVIRSFTQPLMYQVRSGQVRSGQIRSGQSV